MTVEDVVNKLVGPIEPVGDSSIDEQRYENLVVMCELVQALSFKIASVAISNKNRYEASMKKCGQKADNFIKHELP